MNLEYKEVPDIITGKDLDYLSDMFTWNYGGYKKTQNCLKQIQEEEIKNMIEKVSNMFYQNMNKILSKLNGGIYNNEQ